MVVELSDFCNVESLIVAQVLGNVQLVEVGVLLLALKGELLPVAMGVFREVDSEVLQVELEVGVELVHFAHSGTPVKFLGELLPEQPLQVSNFEHFGQELLHDLLLAPSPSFQRPLPCNLLLPDGGLDLGLEVVEAYALVEDVEFAQQALLAVLYAVAILALQAANIRLTALVSVCLGCDEVIFVEAAEFDEFLL